MKEHHIDVLFMQNNNDFMGGYVKYFTDLPATNGYATAVVFPKDDDMIVITHGPYGTDRKVRPSRDVIPRGTKRVLAEPYFSSAPYSTAFGTAGCPMHASLTQPSRSIASRRSRVRKSWSSSGTPPVCRMGRSKRP